MSPRLYRLVTEDEAGVYADVALPALRDVLAAAARDAEKAERFGHVISLTADWLTHLEALATGSSPLAQEVRRQAQALRRALDGTS